MKENPSQQGRTQCRDWLLRQRNGEVALKTVEACEEAFATYTPHLMSSEDAICILLPLGYSTIDEPYRDGQLEAARRLMPTIYSGGRFTPEAFRVACSMAIIPTFTGEPTMLAMGLMRVWWCRDILSRFDNP